MIVAIVFAGFVAGLASGSVVLFLFDLGWLLGIGGFYAGALVGVGIAAVRVAMLADGEKDRARTSSDVPTHDRRAA